MALALTKGEVEECITRRPLINYEVYEQVKGFEIIFGKIGQGLRGDDQTWKHNQSLGSFNIGEI